VLATLYQHMLGAEHPTAPHNTDSQHRV
jgi:hypothetical protein